MGKLRVQRGRTVLWKRARERLWALAGNVVRGLVRNFDPPTCLACVGLIVLVGCFTLVIAPESEEGERSFPLSRQPAVVIDAGHGGRDEGAKSRGVQEKTMTLEIALRLEQILNGRGFPTVQTRTQDVYVSLADRADIANRVKGPAIFVSIHFNQGGDRSTAGIETFYADAKVPPANDWTWIGLFSQSEPLDTGEDLAAEVQYAVVLKTGARDRGIRARHLYVTRHTRLPAVLVEGGFLSNPMESHLLNDDDYASSLAEGIADGIEAWWRRAQHPAGPPTLAQKR